MREIQELLERQARWQEGLRELPWSEKIRMAERVREGYEQWIMALRKDREKASAASKRDT